MPDLKNVIQGLECCSKYTGDECQSCPYEPVCKPMKGARNPLMMDAISLLKAQKPRVMTLEEVGDLPYGHVLIETDKKDSLRWVDALLFCKNTNFSFDFITLEGYARLWGTAYNMEWRCWTSRPTNEQREVTPWNV